MRILFVARQDSIHTARWISQVAGRGWDLHLFPAVPGGPSVEMAGPHPSLRDVTVYGISSRRDRRLDASVRVRGVVPAGRAAALLSWELEPRFPSAIAWFVRRLKPDIVHSLEMQRAGYITQAAKQKHGDGFPPWIVSNWGSDISVFGRVPEHADRIGAVLAHCDYYSCECERDVRLARDFGFQGTVLPVRPNAGGFDLAKVRELRERELPSRRRVVALKGYQHWAGRALVGLKAVELCADKLRDYRVALYSPGEYVELAATLTSQATGIPIDVVSRATHEEIMELHSTARASVALSIGDGISTASLEAMAVGSLPIQSSTSCLGDWVRDGETGLLVDAEDPHSVARALERAVGDDRLVDEAATLNSAVVEERLDRTILARQVAETYEEIAAR
jgi:glycosyltransferase involved in cell wall biosynthesis